MHSDDGRWALAETLDGVRVRLKSVAGFVASDGTAHWVCVGKHSWVRFWGLLGVLFNHLCTIYAFFE